MSTNLGAQEAQRILSERNRDEARLTRQERDERILRTEPPDFFEAMAKCLEENVTSFNLEMSLSGEDELTFVYSSGMVQIGKRKNPFLLRKAIHLQMQREVTVRTETINHYRHGVKEEKWRFTVEHGELVLDGRNLLECADALFAGIADAFR
jgi:hypothetical protein